MSKRLGCLAVLAWVLTSASFVFAQQEQNLGGVMYGMADWPDGGFGDHRALVDADVDAADAVRARIPWRRHDIDFRSKAVLVYDLATGTKIRNVFACNITRENGDVVFQPKTVPGQYAIYYMPYQQPETTSGEWGGSYLPPLTSADPGWLAKHGLNVPVVENSIRFVETRKKDEGDLLNASFELISGSLAGFADNCTMTYEVRFANHAGNFVVPTLLLQEDGRGYRPLVYDLGGRLVMAISRKDCEDDKKNPELVKGNWDSPWPVKMDHWITVTTTVKALPDRTVVTLQARGEGSDGQPFTSPLITADDSTPQRIGGGGISVGSEVAKYPPSTANTAAPAEPAGALATERFLGSAGLMKFRLYPGDDGAGTWVRNLVIQDSTGKVVFSSDNAKRGGSVENTATIPKAILDALPQAKLARMESRLRHGERANMNSFFPMEIIASEKEQADLLAKHADSVLLFPEDRSRPVVMPDFLPQSWALDGPQEAFRGAAQPGEYYCWQIGVYAAREDVGRLSVKYSDITSPAGIVIKAQDITCFNLEGIDIHGDHFTKEFSLGKGMVRPLWIGMMVPDGAKGDLCGDVKLSINDKMEKTIRFHLNVDGPIISNHGDDEPWRHSRLRWLNSTLGLDDQVLPLPFTAVKRQGMKVDILNRTLQVNPQGLTERIVSNGVDVLASPIRIDVVGAEGQPLAFNGPERNVEMENPSRVIETTHATCSDLKTTLRSELWFDGVINYDLTLRSENATTVKDVAVVIPMRKELAKYLIGFSNRGDRRPTAWQWKWNTNYIDNCGWFGDAEAGIGIKLLPEHDYWDPSGLRWDEHREWINDGKGGVTLSEDGDAVVLRAFTGERALSAKEPLRLRFRLYVTPFKPLRNDHWSLRFFDNITHYHHSTPENPYINYPFMTIDVLKNAFQDLRAKGIRGMTIYYTLRELSNIAPELFALRSLGTEVVKNTGAFVYSTSGWSVNGEGGGHPWLREHLVSGYSPGWQQTVYNGDIDAAVATSGDGRLLNYYIEGLAWLQKRIGFVGVYLDGIGYDRIGMLRLARTLTAGGSDYYLPFHSGDDFKNPWSELHAAPAANYMEHLPFVTQLMWGECFWYDGPEGYWMTELAGLPFGIDNQFYPVPGPSYPFRSMLYAASENVGPSAADVRALWDRWGIDTQTRTLGYWDKKCPVRTNVHDIFASVYANEGKALICVGSWAKETRFVTLSVDWKALGIDPTRVKITVPDVGCVQEPQGSLDITQPIQIEPGRGIVIGLESIAQ
jgi:hypothetical protein